MAEKCEEIQIGELYIYKDSKSSNSIMYSVCDKTYKKLSSMMDIRFNKNDEFGSKFRELINCITSYNNTKYNDVEPKNTIYLETITNGGIKGLGKSFFKFLKDNYKEYKYIFLYPSKTLGEKKSDKSEEEIFKERIQNRNKLINYYKSLGFEIVGNITDVSNNVLEIKPAPCLGNFFGVNNLHYNPFDNDAPYFLMIVEISKLNVDKSIDIPEITKEIQLARELELYKKKEYDRKLKLFEENVEKSGINIGPLPRTISQPTKPTKMEGLEEEEGPVLKRSRSGPNSFEQKYLKYKQKYLQLKSQLNKLKLN